MQYLLEDGDRQLLLFDNFDQLLDGLFSGLHLFLFKTVDIASNHTK